jgi:hypothetical protein
MAHPPTAQRAIMNRHHQARRSNSNIAPKLEPGAVPVSHSIMHSNQSPQSRQTPSSHHSSPTSNSPGFPTQGVMTPPASESQIVQQQQQQQQQRTLQPLKQVHHGLPGPTAAGLGVSLGSPLKGPGRSGIGSMGGAPAAYYPSPFQNHLDGNGTGGGSNSFQNHIEQLGKLTRPLLSYFFPRALFVLD